jgi:hypothetical protein
MDFNIDNYSEDELFSILELDDISIENVSSKIQYYLQKFQRNINMKTFFTNMKDKLMNYFSQEEEEEEEDKEGFETLMEQYNQDKQNEETQDENDDPASQQQQEWYDREYLLQNDMNQNNKLTDRVQKTKVFNNNHDPMNRQQIGITNNYQVPYSQDTLNPTLENTISRLVNLDSQFRQSTSDATSISSEYTLDLSEPLKNVLNISLYSFSIPYTWYTIDTQYDNNYFQVVNKNNTFEIEISVGNYNSQSFCIELNNQILAKGFIPYNDASFVTLIENQGKIELQFNQAIDPSGNNIVGLIQGNVFSEETDPYFLFYSPNEKQNITCSNNKLNIGYIDNTLGWIMGYRLPILPIQATGNPAPFVLDLFGPKYFIITLDDYNSNRINNGLITITELSSKLAFPRYYNPTVQQVCFQEINNSAILNQEFEGSTNGLLYIEKLEIVNTQVPQVTATSPRTLTQAQIYTINEISKNRSKITNTKNKPPNQSDSFAIIPIKKGNINVGDVYCDFGGSLQENKRKYFGPVNVSRISLKITNDKGFLVDLHGGEWTITLLCEELYQY